jgi:hypothetical protein
MNHDALSTNFTKSTITEGMNVLPTQSIVFETGTTLPGRSEVSPAATTPCRLQLITAFIKTFPIQSQNVMFLMKGRAAVLSSKSEDVPLLTSCQSVNPGLRQMFTFRNKASFYGEDLSAPRPKPKAGGPPLVGCPRLLIPYIRSYLYIGGRSSIRNLGLRHAVVTGTHRVLVGKPEG